MHRTPFIPPVLVQEESQSSVRSVLIPPHFVATSFAAVQDVEQQKKHCNWLLVSHEEINLHKLVCP